MNRDNARDVREVDCRARKAGPGGGDARGVALLVLMVLTSAGVAFVAITKSEKQIAGNEMLNTQAFYAAEAGITEGIARMSYEKDSLNYIGPPGLPTPGWGRYLVIASGASAQDPNVAALASDGMDNDGDNAVDESGERYPEVLTKQSAGANMLRYPYVRIEYKLQSGQLVRFGDADHNVATPPTENLVNGPPVLRVTSSGRRGSAQKVVEVEAVRFPLVNANSAIWAGGPMSFNGNSFLIDGHDHDADAPHDTIPGAAAVPGIMTEGPVTDAVLAGNQEDNVMGSGGFPSVEHSTYSYDFNQLWVNLVNVADYSFTGDQSFANGTPQYGTMADPKVTIVKGNLDASGPWQGAGILMVDGNLSMTGGSTFKGIVVVTGDVKLAGGGPADDARIVGAIIYQGSLINASSSGGNGRIFYSSEAVNNALTIGRYQVAWWREK
jgi:hypothetical protein